MESSNKSLLIAVILWFFIGMLALHRFYVGKIFTGILMILSLFTVIGFFIWWIVDGIMLVSEHFKDSDGHKLIWSQKIQSF